MGMSLLCLRSSCLCNGKDETPSDPMIGCVAQMSNGNRFKRTTYLIPRSEAVSLGSPFLI